MVSRIIIFLSLIFISVSSLYAETLPQTKPDVDLLTNSLVINGSLGNGDPVWRSRQAKCFYELDPNGDNLVMLMSGTSPSDGGTEEDLSGTGKTITYTSGRGWSLADKVVLVGSLGDILNFGVGDDAQLEVTNHSDFEMVTFTGAAGATITEVETDCAGTPADNQTICLSGANNLRVGDVVQFDITECGYNTNQQYIIKTKPNATTVTLCDEGFGTTPCAATEDLTSCSGGSAPTAIITRGEDVDFSFIGWVQIDRLENVTGGFLGLETNANDAWKSFPNFDATHFLQRFHIMDKIGSNGAKADCARANNAEFMFDDIWYNLAYSYDSSQGADIYDRMLMWRDGIAASNPVNTGSNCVNYASMHLTGVPLNIGNDEGGNGLEGFMGMMGLYRDQVFTEEDVQRFYNCSRGYYGK